MAITNAQVRWGSYLQYEGPWTTGVHRMEAPPLDATFAAKVLYVIASTEGAAFDAVNMYDRCIMTLGCIQFCDAGQFSVCDMLGEVAEVAPSALEEVREYVARRGFEFKKTPRGRWRFHGANGEVDTTDEQRRLYLKNSSGLRGTWDTESKEWARGFVIAIASVWDDPAARDAQLAFTFRRLRSFVFGPGEELFADIAQVSFGLSDAELEAARAGYFSYAANLPSVASKQFAAWRAIAEREGIVGTEWVTGLLRTLTYGPAIAIYPGRYGKIAPVIRKYWGVDIPATSQSLAGTSTSANADKLKDVRRLQRALIALGFDLGPKGVDGIYGPKTTAAVVIFQSLNDLVPDGIVGPKTKAAIVRALRKARQLSVLD